MVGYRGSNLTYGVVFDFLPVEVGVGFEEKTYLGDKRKDFLVYLSLLDFAF